MYQKETSTQIFSSEAVAQKCSVKKVFLEISPNSHKKTCAGVSFLIRFIITLLKKWLWYKCIPLNLAKFLRTHFLTEHLWWLLLFLMNIGKFIRTPTLKNICKRLLLWKLFCKNILQIITSQRKLLMRQKWKTEQKCFLS